MTSKKFDLENGELREIRNALHIGLASYGEIERLTNSYGLAELSGKRPATDLKPIHPTGAPDTVSMFANALRYVDMLEAQPTA